MEEQLPSGLGEGQVAKLVEHDEVETREVLRELAGATLAALGLQPVDEVGGVEEARPGAALMQARAIAIARCVLPVPVPPTSTTLRWLARKLPEARSRTRPSLIGVSAKVKSAISFASGIRAIVIWYLMDRACFSAISAFSRLPTMMAAHACASARQP